MTEPDDRELQDYLKGDGRLSRAYRKASAETTPPLLDEAILARSRAELKRKPDWSRALAPYALAASLLLGVNLAWNVYQERPLPPTAVMSDSVEAGAPAPNIGARTGATAEARQAPAAKKAPSAPAPANGELALADRAAAAPASAPGIPAAAKSKARAEAEAEADSAGGARERQSMTAPTAARSAATPAAAESNIAAPQASAGAGSQPALTEEQKIDRLIEFIGALDGAAFIRNGKEHSPQDAVEHLRLKRRKAGTRVRTAEEFIERCATRSSISGDDYQIRFADGRTESAATVLRRRLGELEN